MSAVCRERRSPAGRWPRDPCCGRGDAGVAAVLVLALAGVLTLVGAGSASLAAVAVARQRAASAADLSALAAAERARLGQDVACTQARRIAEAVGARLGTCTLTGGIAEVQAQVRPPGRLGMLGEASARARAGPTTAGTVLRPGQDRPEGDGAGIANR